MPKVSLALLLITLLAVPLFAAANWQWGAPDWEDECTIGYDLTDIHPTCAQGQTVNIEEFGVCCVFNAVYLVTGWIFWFMIALVILLVVVGGFFILTSAGAPEKVTRGRTLIIWAVVGLIIALFARAIPYLARTVMGIGAT